MVAVALLVFGLLGVLVETQSSSLIYWTGEHTTGTSDGGLTYYSAEGRKYTIDGPSPAVAQPTPVSVWFDGEDPAQARYDQPARWVDAASVLSPFVAAAVCLLIWARR